MSPEFQSRLAHKFRVWLFLVVLLAAIPTFLTIRDWRFVHWMNTDSVRTTATAITYDHPALKYSYTISQRSFEGSEKTATPFNPGDKFDVFVSASHPWMSSLAKPPLTFEDGGYFVMGLALAVLVPSIALLASLREEKSASSGRSALPNNHGGEFPKPPPRPQ